ncbi:hypothetical protein CM00_gp39 [Mycobacterium phage Kugel]|uniref:Uncharacterized protein n=1 Tax=Mycobacterium phage Kugel TaxID=2923003 RepID=G8IB77_9CAUD|nr:hypothetical protein CM00_gp39 [Mycobacterium phage Kugel]AER49971.1 hypothetical protein KUGEL_39 [Mycobacterium phage Kugel]
MSWTYISKHAYRAEGCICVRSRGDHAQCPLHQEEYRLRQTGCSCFAGWQMSDGSWVDPYCTAHAHDNGADSRPVTEIEDDDAMTTQQKEAVLVAVRKAFAPLTTAQVAQLVKGPYAELGRHADGRNPTTE